MLNFFGSPSLNMLIKVMLIIKRVYFTVIEKDGICLLKRLRCAKLDLSFRNFRYTLLPFTFLCAKIVLINHCAKTVVSPYFLVWKFCGKAQFSHSFGRIARNYAKSVPFHKISASGNQAKLLYFSQCKVIIIVSFVLISKIIS